MMIGAISISDAVRPEAPEAVEKLKDLGISHILMVSGVSHSHRMLQMQSVDFTFSIVAVYCAPCALRFPSLMPKELSYPCGSSLARELCRRNTYRLQF